MDVVKSSDNHCKICRDFYGTVVVPNNVFGHHYDDPGSGCSDYAFGSLKCRCQQGENLIG